MDRGRHHWSPRSHTQSRLTRFALIKLNVRPTMLCSRRYPMLAGPFISFCLLMSGCSTTKELHLGTGEITTSLRAAAIAVSAGNTERMNGLFTADLKTRGFAEVRLVDPGTRRLHSADFILEYKDEWVWDLVMYLHSIEVTLYDPLSGKVIARTSWRHNSYVFHAYTKPEDVIRERLDELLASVKRRQ
jgi:hypothetical protein